jgi:hypothetical protein
MSWARRRLKGKTRGSYILSPGFLSSKKRPPPLFPGSGSASFSSGSPPAAFNGRPADAAGAAQRAKITVRRLKITFQDLTPLQEQNSNFKT